MQISLIVPVYNEEETINTFYETVREQLPTNTEIIFINDGSYDETENIINDLSLQDEFVIAKSFIRNFGKEPALFAGLTLAKGDCVIPIDVDGQDPIAIIPQMVAKWQEGNKIVLAKRVNRDSDSFLKKFTAEAFYKIYNLFAKNKIVENVGDFRLLDKSIVKELIKMPERNLFMKGVLSFLDDKNVAIVEYSREIRSAGESKFNTIKLLNLAFEGISSFSIAPLKLSLILGFIVASFSFLLACFFFFRTIIFGIDLPGFAAMITSILFLGGVQLFCIGILGEYIGRIYIETKQRPRFVFKE